MDKKTYSITLADGTVIANLSLNGDNYISKTEIDPSVFADNLSPVVISDGETQEQHAAMALIQVKKYGSEWWVALRDMTQRELADIKTRADLDYIALMCGVDL